MIRNQEPSLPSQDPSPKSVAANNRAVRAAQLGDLQSLRPILEQWMRDHETGELLTSEVDHTMQTIEASVRGQNNRTYVVAQDSAGQLMGIMGMVTPGEDMRPYATSDKPIELVSAYVDRQRKGTGVGRLLAEALEAQAASLGYTEIIVNSGPRYKESGWPFWTKLCGESVAVRPDHYGPGLDAPVWRKSLATK